MTDKFDKLGRLIDSLENLQYALNLQLPPTMHVDQLRKSIPELVTAFKKSFVEIAGEDPWEFHPKLPNI